MIWQLSGVYQPGHGFDVYLDRNFALEMASASLSGDKQDRFNSLLVETINDFGFDYPRPVVFDGQTPLINEFHLGGNGIWLSMESDSRHALKAGFGDGKPLIYNSHNTDTAKEAYALMAMFDRWISYADILRE